jgi:hypothetical protein
MTPNWTTSVFADRKLGRLDKSQLVGAVICAGVSAARGVAGRGVRSISQLFQRREPNRHTRPVILMQSLLFRPAKSELLSASVLICVNRFAVMVPAWFRS